MFLLHSCVWLFATPWAVACLAPLSTEFFRQELEWLPLLSPGDLPNPGIEPGSPSLQTDSLPSEPPGKPIIMLINYKSLLENFPLSGHIPSVYFNLHNKAVSYEAEIL